MRNFNSMIFLGNGARSEKSVALLYSLLDSAISELSGLQQGGAVKGSVEFIEAENKIEDIAKDIYCVLTCKEVISTEEVSYPGKKIKISANLRKYKELGLRLHQKKTFEDTECDKIRDAMDIYWYKLTEEEILEAISYLKSLGE